MCVAERYDDATLRALRRMTAEETREWAAEQYRRAQGGHEQVWVPDVGPMSPVAAVSAVIDRAHRAEADIRVRGAFSEAARAGLADSGILGDDHPDAAEAAPGYRCGGCGRLLSSPESIARGMGPGCASKAGL